MTTDHVTYDELLDGTDTFTVERHQTFADTGTILVSQPGSVLDATPLRPGSRLNYDLDDGKVVAYSVGPAEDDKPKGKKQTAKVEPATEQDTAR